MSENLENVITKLRNLPPEESYDFEEGEITICKDEEGSYRVEASIFLFGKPEWEINIEGQGINQGLINELEKLATDLHNRLKNTAQAIKLGFEKKWQVMEGLYDISIYKYAETPQEALAVCKEAQEILDKLGEHNTPTETTQENSYEEPWSPIENGPVPRIPDLAQPGRF